VQNGQKFVVKLVFKMMLLENQVHKVYNKEREARLLNNQGDIMTLSAIYRVILT
jgi:hypothetical protein